MVNVQNLVTLLALFLSQTQSGIFFYRAETEGQLRLMEHIKTNVKDRCFFDIDSRTIQQLSSHVAGLKQIEIIDLTESADVDPVVKSLAAKVEYSNIYKPLLRMSCDQWVPSLGEKNSYHKILRLCEQHDSQIYELIESNDKLDRMFTLNASAINECGTIGYSSLSESLNDHLKHLRKLSGEGRCRYDCNGRKHKLNQTDNALVQLCTNCYTCRMCDYDTYTKNDCFGSRCVLDEAPPYDSNSLFVIIAHIICITNFIFLLGRWAICSKYVGIHANIQSMSVLIMLLLTDLQLYDIWIIYESIYCLSNVFLCHLFCIVTISSLSCVGNKDNKYQFWLHLWASVVFMVYLMLLLLDNGKSCHVLYPKTMVVLQVIAPILMKFLFIERSEWLGLMVTIIQTIPFSATLCGLSYYWNTNTDEDMESNISRLAVVGLVNSALITIRLDAVKNLYISYLQSADGSRTIVPPLSPEIDVRSTSSPRLSQSPH